MTVRARADKPAIVPLSDQALVIMFGSIVDPAINRHACHLADLIVAARIAAVTDVVPSFTAVTVHYDAGEVACKSGESPHAAMERQVDKLIDAFVKGKSESAAQDSEVVEIPVCYGGAYGPDLQEAALACGLTTDELLALHQQAEPLRVYMIGFAPGAPYIGEFDERLALPRRATPRVLVPAGSVGIANRQSVIYPVAAPGGWSLIGRTPLVLFDPVRDPPALLGPGSLVRFRAIGEDELLAWPAP